MKYCTIQGAAAGLGVSRPTVYKLIAEKKLKRYVLLGRPAIKVSDVERLTAKRDGKGKK